ncbi:MAG: alpha/beta hydrolase [Tannerellaceae bacterium]|nr:alpha/beta hydrolase [Tannerellaceae bacterium]
MADTIEVTRYLCKRFGQEKIHLMGHSFGTFIGLYAVKRQPDLYHSYIGIAQIVKQFDSEKIAYRYIIERYKEKGNDRMIKRMEKYNLSSMDTISLDYAVFRDGPMHHLGIGTMHDMKSVISGIFLPVMKFSEYNFSEKINFWKAKSFILNKTNLWETMMATDIAKEIKSLDIPVYFMHGIYDYTVNYLLTKEYYETLETPLKGFYTFEQSAHSPVFEEPEKFMKILLEDVLPENNNNADKH